MGGLFTKGTSQFGKLWSIGTGVPQKLDPGGTVLGLFGKNASTPIDPATFTGVYGWDVKGGKAATDPNSFNVDMANTQAGAPNSGGSDMASTRRALLAATDGNPSTSKILLGQ